MKDKKVVWFGNKKANQDIQKFAQIVAKKSTLEEIYVLLDETIRNMERMLRLSDKSSYDVRLKEILQIRSLIVSEYGADAINNAVFFGVTEAANYLAQVSNSPFVKIGMPTSIVYDVNSSRNLAKALMSLKATRAAVARLMSSK